MTAPAQRPAGVLYLVATPLGNLQDLTPRAAATLAAVDFIAAEDTRVTLRLLNHLGIKKPLVSYHEHSAPARGEQILARVQAGESCAVCTDAGMPCISDPGEALVRAALESGVQVVPVPGATAAATALAASGQAGGRWCFEGFLPGPPAQRRQRLQELAGERRTMVLYEAPHRLCETLAQLAGALGGERGVTVCRELTKLHEEIWRTTLAAAQARYAGEAPRGEFCLVVEGAPAPARTAQDEAAALAAALAAAGELAAQGLPPAAAAREAAHRFGLPMGRVYAALLQARQAQGAQPPQTPTQEEPAP